MQIFHSLQWWRIILNIKCQIFNWGQSNPHELKAQASDCSNHHLSWLWRNLYLACMNFTPTLLLIMPRKYWFNITGAERVFFFYCFVLWVDCIEEEAKCSTQSQMMQNKKGIIYRLFTTWKRKIKQEPQKQKYKNWQKHKENTNTHKQRKMCLCGTKRAVRVSPIVHIQNLPFLLRVGVVSGSPVFYPFNQLNI